MTPEALVKGWNKALKRILTTVEEDLNQIDLKTVIPRNR